jgi:Ca2+-transporting ATPase
VNATPNRGLSAAEASERPARDGPNELPGAARRGAWGLLRDVVLEPMSLLLVACGAINLALAIATKHRPH